jgi:hypothetical protein
MRSSWNASGNPLIWLKYVTYSSMQHYDYGDSVDGGDGYYDHRVDDDDDDYGFVILRQGIRVVFFSIN